MEVFAVGVTWIRAGFGAKTDFKKLVRCMPGYQPPPAEDGE